MKLHELENKELLAEIQNAYKLMDEYEADHAFVMKEIEPIEEAIENNRLEAEKKRKALRLSKDEFPESEAGKEFKKKEEELRDKWYEVNQKFPNLNEARDVLNPLLKEAYFELIEQSGLSEADYRREAMFEDRGIEEPMAGQSGLVFPDGRMVEISHEKTQTHYGDIEWLCNHCEPDTTASRGDLTARALVIGEGNVEWNDKYNEFTMDFNHKLTDEQKEFLYAFIDEAKDKMMPYYDNFTLCVDKNDDGRHTEIKRTYQKDTLDFDKVIQDINEIQNGHKRERVMER